MAAPGVVVVGAGCKGRGSTLGISIMQLLLVKRFDGWKLFSLP